MLIVKTCRVLHLNFYLLLRDCFQAHRVDAVRYSLSAFSHYLPFLTISLFSPSASSRHVPFLSSGPPAPSPSRSHDCIPPRERERTVACLVRRFFVCDGL